MKNDGDYVPIAPTSKKGFEIQLRLRNHLGLNQQDIVLFITTLPKYSYLKIDSCYKLPFQALIEARDYFNNPLMICSKHRGGLGELRAHVRRRDRNREERLSTEKSAPEQMLAAAVPHGSLSTFRHSWDCSSKRRGELVLPRLRDRHPRSLASETSCCRQGLQEGEEATHETIQSIGAQIAPGNKRCRVGIQA